LISASRTLRQYVCVLAWLRVHSTIDSIGHYVYRNLNATTINEFRVKVEHAGCRFSHNARCQ